MWKTISDMMAEIHAAHARLVGGDVDVDQAHAEARLLGVACKTVDLRLHHARLTGRLEQGADSLPDVRLTATDENRDEH